LQRTTARLIDRRSRIVVVLNWFEELKKRVLVK